MGAAWPVFGFFFITMLCWTGWFSLEPLLLFPLMAILALGLGFVWAKVLQSNLVTGAVRWFKNGQPLIFFDRFITLEFASDGVTIQAFSLGQRRVLMSAVDELYLTFLGTLEVRSMAVCGDNKRLFGGGSGRADVIARMPLSVLDLEKQKYLVKLFEEARPSLITNKRLKDRLVSPVVRGQMMLQLMGALVITFALFDVSYATAAWITMLKMHYGAQLLLSETTNDDLAFFLKSSPAGKSKKEMAQALYDSAESIREHPFPLSWAYKALFNNANSQAQLKAMRAQTLYQLGKLKDSIILMEEACDGSPSGFKNQLILTRYLYEDKQFEKAREILTKVLEKHKDVLMPRIYKMSLVAPGVGRDKEYKEALAELDEQVFGAEPCWPPGGEKPIMEMWRRDDLVFLSKRFVLPEPTK